MSTSFTSDFFAGNRKRLRELFTGTAPIVLGANGLVQRGADLPFPFCQDASFWYFTGCDDPDVIVVLDRDKEYFIVPERDAVRVVFDGAVDDAGLKQVSGIETVYSEKQGWKKLEARLEKSRHVATLPAAPNYIDHLGMYANPARRRLIDRIKVINSTIELLDLSEHVMRLRMVKQPAEVMAIEQAADVTIKGFKQTLQPSKLKSYRYEYEVEAELSRAFRRLGSRAHAFTPVIAGGINACTMHNEENASPLVAGQFLLFDIGAEVDHYAADVARTVALGTISPRQRAVHEAVQDALAYAVSLLKPGTLLKVYEKQVEVFIGEKLRELGLIKTITSEAVRGFYPHAASHFLGLNPHDIGLYDQPLEPGMVLAVEPGIYIPAESIGVRIEDDVLITADGNRVLTTALSRGFEV